LADLKPNTCAISARVGGAPVSAMVFLDEFQDSLLTGGELGLIDHGAVLERWLR